MWHQDTFKWSIQCILLPTSRESFVVLLFLFVFFFGLRHKDVTTDCLPKQASFVSKYTLVVTMKFVSRKYMHVYNIAYVYTCACVCACTHVYMNTTLLFNKQWENESPYYKLQNPYCRQNEAKETTMFTDE